MSFPEDGHHKAFVCNHVFDHTRPVLLVSRPDGDWCFLCGEQHPDDSSAYEVVGICHVLDSDSSLAELHDLPSNWEAERKKVGQDWIRIPYIPSE
jgi:hypothetical protein